MKIYNYPMWGKLFLSLFFGGGGIVIVVDFFVQQKEPSHLAMGVIILLIGLFIWSFSAHIITSEKEIGSFLLGLCLKKCKWEEIESITTWKDLLGGFNVFLVVTPSKNDEKDISSVNFKSFLFRKEIKFDSSLNNYKELLKEVKEKAVNAKFNNFPFDLMNNKINNRQKFAITFSNFAKVGVFIEIGFFLSLLLKILKIV